MVAEIRQQKNKNLGALLKPHENQWVALSPDYKKVITSGRTLHSVRRRLNTKEKRKAVFLKVVPFDVNYVPVV